MREENVAVNAAFVRVLASPVPATATVDAVCDALGRHAKTLQPVLDPDMNCSIWNAAQCPDAGDALAAAAGSLRACAPGSIFTFDVQGGDAATPDTVMRLGAALSEALDAPIYAAQRAVPASEWTALAPITLGVAGFGLRAVAPTQARDGSAFRGASLSVGAPTVLFKVGLQGMPSSALARICHAVGDAHGGLLHIGAYPGISSRTGEPLLLLECSDVVKSPLHRALDLIDIECARYGSSVGPAVVLSYIPLAALTGTLAARMGLNTQPAQIIETRLREAESR
jgi:hypothetical protein